DLQTRNMTYAVDSVPGSGGMACSVTATSKNGKYTIETQYVTDPSRNTVLMRIKLKPSNTRLRLYVRFDATVNGHGRGGRGHGEAGGAASATVDASTGHPVLVSSDPVTVTNAANRDYAQPVYAALDGALSEATSGFVGEPSDGLVQLDTSHAITSPTSDAANGNVVQAARVALDDGVGTLALGFGISQAEAVGAAEGSLASSFGNVLASFKQGWKNYDHSLNDPHLAKQLEDEYYLSANVIKASEDKMFPGSIVASLASPWG